MRGENYSPFNWDFQEQDKVAPSGGGKGGDGVTQKKVNKIVDAKLATIGIGGKGLEYVLKVDGESAGVINIPKDRFLKSVSYNKETQNLVFVMETESGEVTTQLGTFATTESVNEGIANLSTEKENEIYKLTQIIGDLGGAVTYELPNEIGKSFNTLMSNNGTVKLTDDVSSGRFGPGITAKNSVKLNLNTHNLTITGLTTSSTTPGIMARGTQNITITGKGVIDAGQGICVGATSTNCVINLNGGTTTYQTNRSGGELIYCYAGTINITAGVFKNDGENKTFLLNCYDANYKNGTAQIIVTGGKFYDFDPANNTAEGENTSFVAEGYISVMTTETIDGVEHNVYTVKKA